MSAPPGDAAAAASTNATPPSPTLTLPRPSRSAAPGPTSRAASRAPSADWPSCMWQTSTGGVNLWVRGWPPPLHDEQAPQPADPVPWRAAASGRPAGAVAPNPHQQAPLARCACAGPKKPLRGRRAGSAWRRPQARGGAAGGTGVLRQGPSPTARLRGLQQQRVGRGAQVQRAAVGVERPQLRARHAPGRVQPVHGAAAARAHACAAATRGISLFDAHRKRPATHPAACSRSTALPCARPRLRGRGRMAQPLWRAGKEAESFGSFSAPAVHWGARGTSAGSPATLPPSHVQARLRNTPPEHQGRVALASTCDAAGCAPC